MVSFDTKIAIVVPIIILLCFLPPAVMTFQFPIKKSPAWKSERPALAPPPITFPIVWFVLYALAAAALCLQILMPNASVNAGIQYTGVAFMIAQLILGFAWPAAWYKNELKASAYIIIAMLAFSFPGILLAAKTNILAGALWSPLLAWLIFALILNTQSVSMSKKNM